MQGSKLPRYKLNAVSALRAAGSVNVIHRRFNSE
jgi:hypothetical protein